MIVVLLTIFLVVLVASAWFAVVAYIVGVLYERHLHNQKDDTP